MNDLVTNEVNRIAGNVEPRGKFTAKKLEQKKSAFQIAAEKFTDQDLDNVKNDIKTYAKRRGLAFIGELIIEMASRVFLSGRKSGGGSVVRSYDNPSYRNYSSYSTSSGGVSKAPSAGARRFDFVDLVYPKRSDCQWLLDILEDKITAKGRCSVMDLYDETDDPTSMEMHDDEWGWYSFDGYRIEEWGNGYRLFLPEPIKLDNH